MRTRCRLAPARCGSSSSALRHIITTSSPARARESRHVAPSVKPWWTAHLAPADPLGGPLDPSASRALWRLVHIAEMAGLFPSASENLMLDAFRGAERDRPAIAAELARFRCSLNDLYVLVTLFSAAPRAVPLSRPLPRDPRQSASAEEQPRPPRQNRSHHSGGPVKHGTGTRTHVDRLELRGAPDVSRDKREHPPGSVVMAVASQRNQRTGPRRVGAACTPPTATLPRSGRARKPSFPEFHMGPVVFFRGSSFQMFEITGGNRSSSVRVCHHTRELFLTRLRRRPPRAVEGRACPVVTQTSIFARQSADGCASAGKQNLHVRNTFAVDGAPARCKK